MIKTNAMRILDSMGIDYVPYCYPTKDGKIDGVSVAEKIGKPVGQVFKTILTKGDKEYYVFIVPVACELNLKSAAVFVGEKSVELIKIAEINKVTGYVRGGCSPIGMKKSYRTVMDNSCMGFNTIICSAGKVGIQIEIGVLNLIRIINAETADIADKETIMV